MSLTPELMQQILNNANSGVESINPFSRPVIPVHKPGGIPRGHGDNFTTQNFTQQRFADTKPPVTAAEGSKNQGDLEEVIVTARRRPTRDPIKYLKSSSDLNIITFPLDLNQKNMPHMLIKIYPTVVGQVEATDTNASRNSITAGASELTEVVVTGARTASAAGVSALNEVDSPYLRAATNVAATSGNAVKDVISSAESRVSQATIGSTSIVSDVAKSFSQFSLNRNADQLAAAIALFMPEGINTNYSHSYDELSLTSSLGGMGLFLQGLASKTGSAATRDAFIMEGAASIASNFTQKASDLSSALLFATTGKAVNPQLEMLYKSPNLRTFTFDFRLVPRNSAEASTIVGIINLLKHHSSPEIPAGTTGRYFIPPARFEIEFYNDQTDNPNPYLFKTKQCVLTEMSVDYSPNGYSSFYDGAPVETRLQLQFKETVILDKFDVLAGY